MGVNIQAQGHLREGTNAPLSSCLFLNLITQILVSSLVGFLLTLSRVCTGARV